MRQLRLVGLAEDGASLLLETPTGESFRLPLDDRVRAACRGDLTRLGQIEIELDNPLRPRDIQARVRAGESAEQVAASSGMPLDRVLRFASPMLQERDRVVAQARTTKLFPRRPETLAELVEERLVGRGTDPATLRWDAWRREDGRWTVRLSWRHAAEHSANWVFQLASRSLQPDDPAAEQLSAEEFHARTITAVTPLAVAARVSGGTGPTSPGAASAPGAAAERGGRRAGTPGGGADGPAGGSGRPGLGGRPAADAGRSAAPGPDPRAAGTGRDGGSAGSRTRRRTRTAETAAGGGGAESAGGDPDGEPAPVETPRRVAAGGEGDLRAETDDERARRASVPSWDDILLGVRRRH